MRGSGDAPSIDALMGRQTTSDSEFDINAAAAFSAELQKANQGKTKWDS